MDSDRFSCPSLPSIKRVHVPIVMHVMKDWVSAMMMDVSVKLDQTNPQLMKGVWGVPLVSLI